MICKMHRNAFSKILFRLVLGSSLVLVCLASFRESLGQSKPAPKGTPPKVTVPPKSERDRPRTSEREEERPRRP